MARTVIVHFTNEDPIIADLEALPGPTDQFITISSPRKLDGKSLPYITPGAVAFMFPMTRITFIEVMSSEEERREVVDFFRE